MLNIKQKLAAGTAAAAILGSILAPVSAFAATDITVSGNGAKSTNTVKVKSSNGSHVSQTNNTAVVTLVSSNSNTGGNKANGNTGGSNSITTGDASSTVTTTVNVGGNHATVAEPCGCDEDTTIDVSGNGWKSNNKVKVKSSNHSSVKQKNNTFVLTGIESNANTGWNKTNHNTGDEGDENTVDTGMSDSTVETTVSTPSNNLNQ